MTERDCAGCRICGMPLFAGDICITCGLEASERTTFPEKRATDPLDHPSSDVAAELRHMAANAEPAQREQADVTAETEHERMARRLRGSVIRCVATLTHDTSRERPLSDSETETRIQVGQDAKHEHDALRAVERDLREKLERCERERDEWLADTRAYAALRSERDAATARAETAERLLRDGVKYVREDRAITPGSTRLVRWAGRVAAHLKAQGGERS